MMSKRGYDINDIFKKYGRKIDEEVANDKSDVEGFSREFQTFKKEMFPELTSYEKWCRNLGSLFDLKLSEKDRSRVQKYLDIAHLDVTPSQTMTLAVVSSLISFFIGLGIFLVIFLLTGNLSFLIAIMTLFVSLFIFYYLYSKPAKLANMWRLKASSQMVPCILYTVAYMKHTSNLERAIVFASKHLQPPLSLDFRKVFWDVETGKFSTLKESLESYLEVWRDSNIEFIESFHLIESSLYEPSEDSRVRTLERALQVILDGVYEKMLKYARDVKSPLTNIYMLGIVLPTLTISLIPLASTLLQGMLKWYHLFILFDMLIPFFVFYLTDSVLMKRPGGHGQTEALESNPYYSKFKSKKPYLIGGIIVIPFFLLGILPFLFQFTGLPGYLGLPNDFKFSEIGLGFLGDSKFFDFRTTNLGIVGPFGMGALLLSLFIPLGIALLFSYAYNRKTKDLIKARKDSKQLEQEFTSSLFQLGNRLGDGMPAEIAFSYVAESTRGQKTEGFFKIVNTNINNLGMSVEQAIFDRKRGALVYYPSALISTSMRILVESVKKGLKIAARSLMSISEYIKNINKINGRLNDLLAEVVSDMKNNMVFLAPLLAGIVVGLGGMITSILTHLSVIGKLPESGMGMVGSFGGILKMLNSDTMIPTYFLQISVGVYIIEIIFILSKTLVTIDAGQDELRKINETGKNLFRGVLFYTLITAVSVIALSLLGIIALGGLSP